ncbi:D-ribose pyranase [Anaerolentibacter hominis]|uniref:D-ribose pyranase n=1 Tax=Anaerolentibacter hominis TaxID=3079009 RepID=UPI0031B87D23
MKKSGILNVSLSAHIAALGHKDLFLIGDAGMPIPPGVPIVDLVLIGGVPSFEQVIRAIENEVVAEHLYLAEEIKEKNPKVLDVIHETFSGVGESCMSHEDLKAFTKNVKFAVRTGEITPFANVIVRAGVAF